uniref:Uncharacterized protein n=1 Tax=Eutreptiella gymnastica TaxID=73025 RepID=A0A7S1NLQ5_9EUGL|mmetsp:Transcript_58303/g.104066  ORF Transcript_58303/g.104066 Transcript_58303/m.104066 type:complete len:472 (+) Transcript_58303:123-1538(+)
MYQYPGYHMMRPDPNEKKKKPTHARINVFITMGPDPSTPVPYSFPLKEPVSTSIAHVLNNLRDRLRQQSCGLMAALPLGNNAENYLMAVASAHGEYDPHAPLDSTRPLKEQFDGPCLMAIYEAPAALAQEKQSKARAQQALEELERHQVDQAELAQMRSLNVRQIEEACQAVEKERLIHCHVKNEELMEELEYLKKVPPPKVSKTDLQSTFNHKIHTIKASMQRRRMETRQMFAHDLESQDFNECCRRWDQLKADEQAQKAEAEARRKQTAEEEARRKAEERRARGQRISRALATSLEDSLMAQARAVAAREEFYVQQMDQFLALDSQIRHQEAEREYYGGLTKAAHERRPKRGPFRSHSCELEPSSLQRHRGVQEASTAKQRPSRASTSLGVHAGASVAVQPLSTVAVTSTAGSQQGKETRPLDGPVYTYQTRLPPMHRLPPVSMPPGAYVEIGRPDRFVQFGLAAGRSV